MLAKINDLYERIECFARLGQRTAGQLAEVLDLVLAIDQRVKHLEAERREQDDYRRDWEVASK